VKGNFEPLDFALQKFESYNTDMRPPLPEIQLQAGGHMRLQQFRIDGIGQVDEMAPVSREKSLHMHACDRINKIHKFLSNYLQFSFLQLVENATKTSIEKQQHEAISWF
jgi:hypothetical protein